LNAARTFLKTKTEMVFGFGFGFEFEFKEAPGRVQNVTGKSVERQHFYRWLEPAAGKPEGLTFYGYNGNP